MSHLINILNDIAAAPRFAGSADMTKGVEKESLRVTASGSLVNSQHPAMLGSALMHPQITTDANEALLEFVTDPDIDNEKVIQQLEALHTFTYQKIHAEQLWPSSMPCNLDGNPHIQTAEYGSSNKGRLKSVYRSGLGLRYGRLLTIAGVHYNFSVSDELWEWLRQYHNSRLSLSDFKTQGYFHLSRNFLRYFWLLLYLFGASPSVCCSLIGKRKHSLQHFNGDESTLYSPYATSLRMSDLGFKSKAQDSLTMTYNCLESYIKTLCGAITQPHPNFMDKGVKNAQGNYQQLNNSLLQIENEFYSVIRPKRTSIKEEVGLLALADRGIEYIEVRCLDIDPYEPTGISIQKMHFLDTFLNYCLLADSPALSQQEHINIKYNQQLTASQGRKPGLTLRDNHQQRSLQEWASSLLVDMGHVAILLDKASGTQHYSDSIVKAGQKVEQPSLTPSAKMLHDMQVGGMSFTQFSMMLSNQHKQYFSQRPLDNLDKYHAVVSHSIAQQLVNLFIGVIQLFALTQRCCIIQMAYGAVDQRLTDTAPFQPSSQRTNLYVFIAFPLLPVTQVSVA